MENFKEIVVIGGGLMGSAAAWHLSTQANEILLLEQQDSQYSFGSSLGEARIARSLGPKDDIFSYLHNRSVAETKKLIRFLNQNDPDTNHQMEDIYTTSPVTYLYYESQKKLVKSLVENQVDTIEYASSPDEANRKFGVSIADSSYVLREFKKYSGTMNPKELIRKLHKGIQYYGHTIAYNQKVTGLKREKNVFRIDVEHTKTGKTQSIRSKKIVSAAGPFSGDLLNEISPVINQRITPKRVFLTFLRIKPQVYRSLTKDQKKKIRESFPVADFTSELMFSMIEKTGEDGIPIFKIGGHFIRKDIADLDNVWKKELTDREKKWGLDRTQSYLNQLQIPIQKNELEYLDGYSCVYSMTRSEIPIVSNLPESENKPDPNAVVLAGMSGVGAKGAMTYGLIAANLLFLQEDKTDMYRRTAELLGQNRLLTYTDEPSSGEDSTHPSSWFVQNR